MIEKSQDQYGLSQDLPDASWTTKLGSVVFTDSLSTSKKTHCMIVTKPNRPVPFQERIFILRVTIKSMLTN
jgi:hypothetical protein